MEYLFDTNAFNRLLDDDVAPSLDGITVYATHVQIEELKATTNVKRRESLLGVFKLATSEVLQTESMVFPLVFGSQKFGDGTYESIRGALDAEVSGLKRKNRRKKEKGHSNDAQIAEVSIKNSYTLVTDDSELISVVSKRDGKVINYDSFASINT